MIEILRKPSEIPNITNTDDFVNLRYAYANQNGYIKNRGAEVSATINGNNLTINSGRLVVQGVECDIDASGETISIDAVLTKRYYTIYLQVNLALNTANILSSNDTLGYPNIESGDDLTKNTTGIANLILYQFTAENGIINDLTKIVKAVEYPLVFNVDNNGVFKIGDVIIPQRKLLWSGNKVINSSNTISITSLGSKTNGRTFEVICNNTTQNKNNIFKIKCNDSQINFSHIDYVNFIDTSLVVYKLDIEIRYNSGVDEYVLNAKYSEDGFITEINEIYEIIE